MYKTKLDSRKPSGFIFSLSKIILLSSRSDQWYFTARGCKCQPRGEADQLNVMQHRNSAFLCGFRAVPGLIYLTVPVQSALSPLPDSLRSSSKPSP